MQNSLFDETDPERSDVVGAWDMYLQSWYFDASGVPLTFPSSGVATAFARRYIRLKAASDVPYRLWLEKRVSVGRAVFLAARFTPNGTPHMGATQRYRWDDVTMTVEDVTESEKGDE